MSECHELKQSAFCFWNQYNYVWSPFDFISIIYIKHPGQGVLLYSEITLQIKEKSIGNLSYRSPHPPESRIPFHLPNKQVCTNHRYFDSLRPFCSPKRFMDARFIFDWHIMVEFISLVLSFYKHSNRRHNSSIIPWIPWTPIYCIPFGNIH